MKPLEDLSAMVTLHFLPRLANRDGALLLHLQAVPLLLQEDVGQKCMIATALMSW